MSFFDTNSFIDYAYESKANVNIKDYPELNSGMFKIMLFIDKSLTNEMRKIIDRGLGKELEVESNPPIYRNDLDCFYLDSYFNTKYSGKGFVSHVDFNKIISATKSKFGNLIKKYNIKITKISHPYPGISARVKVPK